MTEGFASIITELERRKAAIEQGTGGPACEKKLARPPPEAPAARRRCDEALSGIQRGRATEEWHWRRRRDGPSVKGTAEPPAAPGSRTAEDQTPADQRKKA